MIANKITKFKEDDIEIMFNATEIWNQINIDNIQGFDEIQDWFERMKKFFEK